LEEGERKVEDRVTFHHPKLQLETMEMENAIA